MQYLIRTIKLPHWTETVDNIIPYVPPERMLVKPGRPRRKGRSYSAYFHQMLAMNEIAACRQEGKQDKVMRNIFLNDFRQHYSICTKFETRKESVGTFRSRYNTHRLFVNQEQVVLVSFPYNEYNIPLKTGNGSPITFEQAYNVCLKFKIADPRYIPEEYIKEIRNRQINGEKKWEHWKVPSDKHLRELESKIEKPLYKCIRFEIDPVAEEFNQLEK